MLAMSKWIVVCTLALAATSCKKEEPKSKAEVLQDRAKAATQRALDKANAAADKVGDKVGDKASALYGPLRKQLTEVEKELVELDLKIGLAVTVVAEAADDTARTRANEQLETLRGKRNDLNQKIADLRARLGL
jgi:hypothetical protein